MRKKIAVVGGDSRMITAAEKLRAYHDIILYGFDGGEFHGVVDSLCCSGGATERPRKLDSFTVGATLDETLCGCDALILPLPTLIGDNISTPFSDKTISRKELIGSLEKQGVKKLFGGMLGRLYDDAKACGIETYDYFGFEKFVTSNAALTAEGAVAVAMEEATAAIMGMDILVMGFGRIGKLLSMKLCALGANVTVSARKESDLALICALGMKAVETHRISEVLSSVRPFGVIFNTIPHMVLGKTELEAVDEKTIIIDLSSRPGGVDIAAAGKLGRKVIWALSLPGKYAPESAGIIIAETVGSYL